MTTNGTAQVAMPVPGCPPYCVELGLVIAEGEPVADRSALL